MRVRTPHAGSLRFPEQRQSSQGESGPKPRLRSVGDGTSRSYSATTDVRLDFIEQMTIGSTGRFLFAKVYEVKG